jgi:hypothetical protein
MTTGLIKEGIQGTKSAGPLPEWAIKIETKIS